MGTKKLTKAELQELYDLAKAYVGARNFQKLTMIGEFEIEHWSEERLVIRKEAKRRPTKNQFGGWVVRYGLSHTLSPEEAEREKWRPPHSKLVGIRENGKLTIKYRSHRACREALGLLRGHFLLDVLARI